ncbi:MAG: agmatine deiminase family protein [Candidatus Latescibacterota bacterium]|nr:MAG: agmatine deiminase family protein [Candidatus Latescibacterota bacterium]
MQRNAKRYVRSIAAGILVTGLLTVLVSAGVFAQTDVSEEEELNLPIRLTDEEKTRLHEIGMNQVATPPPPGPVRKCAEWEPVTGVLVRYNYGFGLPYGVLQEFAEDITLHVLCRSSQQSTCWDRLETNGVNMANVVLIDIRTNSIWTRDYGPQIHFANGVWCITDLVYNRPRPEDDDVPWQLGTEWGCAVYGTDLVHSGGNFMADGHGIGFSTDMVWDENPGLTHAEIAQEMEDFLGITNYIVVPDINPLGIHHIDCWAKLLSEETILVQEVASGHAFYDALEDRVAYLETLTNCYGRPYNIVRVYCGDIGGGDVAAYTNSLILNDKVFVPTFGISSDATALATYQAAMPGYEVFGFEDGWLEDDAIHCRGMEIHDQYMLVVDTNPIQDMEVSYTDYRVDVYIDDRSETGLVTDSLLVCWRVEGEPDFESIVMEGAADPDSYYADIPIQGDSVNVDYYVFAKDNSGRRSTRPMVAPAAWYTFNTGILSTVATLLQSYSAVLDEFGVTIRWTLAQAGENMQFAVHRAEASEGTFEELVAPEIVGDHLAFSFEDRSCEPGKSYRYRVVVEDEEGRRILFETESISTPVVPLALYQNHPNPFNPFTSIKYFLPHADHVTLEIYDVSGRQVVCLVRGEREQGLHTVEWDGRDMNGNTVSSGTYFYRLRVGKETISRKMILLR